MKPERGSSGSQGCGRPSAGEGAAGGKHYDYDTCDEIISKQPPTIAPVPSPLMGTSRRCSPQDRPRPDARPGSCPPACEPRPARGHQPVAALHCLEKVGMPLPMACGCLYTRPHPHLQAGEPLPCARHRRCRLVDSHHVVAALRHDVGRVPCRVKPGQNTSGARGVGARGRGSGQGGDHGPSSFLATTICPLPPPPPPRPAPLHFAPRPVPTRTPSWPRLPPPLGDSPFPSGAPACPLLPTWSEKRWCRCR